MPTPKGISAKVKAREHAQRWDSFVQQCNKDSTWSMWLSGSHLNKTRISKHLGFSKDVFDDNPAVDIRAVQKKLIREGVINANNYRGIHGLSKGDITAKRRIDSHNSHLLNELSLLLQALLAKSDEIALLNSVLADDKKVDLNGLMRHLEGYNESNSIDSKQLSDSLVLNIQMRDWKLKASTWVKRIKASEQHVALSLRIPKWL